MCDLLRKVELPAEVLLLIVDQIADFKLWYSMRFVCHAWLARILAEQDTKVWKFVEFHNNAFLLPNGVKHGLEIIDCTYPILFPELQTNEEICYYRYGELIKKTSRFGFNTLYSIYLDIPFDYTFTGKSYLSYMKLSNYDVIFKFKKDQCIIEVTSTPYIPDWYIHPD